ncbi:MAG: hypothetical protein IV107_10030 [Paucibacter sp.]|nr:hypothetical protein [Roseateles sp.]
MRETLLVLLVFEACILARNHGGAVGHGVGTALASSTGPKFIGIEVPAMKQLTSPSRIKNALVAVKALLLVAIVWGVVYPGLLWSLGSLMQS